MLSLLPFSFQLPPTKKRRPLTSVASHVLQAIVSCCLSLFSSHKLCRAIAKHLVALSLLARQRLAREAIFVSPAILKSLLGFLLKLCTMSCCTGEEDNSLLEKEGLQGPTENRRCRDLPCLVLYIVFWIGLVVVAGVALSDGEPRRIIYGTDSWGNLCGEKNDDAAINSSLSGLDLTGYSKLYFDPDSDLQLCVASCPNITATTRCSVDVTVCQQLGVCLSSTAYSTPYTGTRHHRN